MPVPCVHARNLATCGNVYVECEFETSAVNVIKVMVATYGQAEEVKPRAQGIMVSNVIHSTQC